MYVYMYLFCHFCEAGIWEAVVNASNYFEMALGYTEGF